MEERGVREYYGKRQQLPGFFFVFCMLEVVSIIKQRHPSAITNHFSYLK